MLTIKLVDLVFIVQIDETMLNFVNKKTGTNTQAVKFFNNILKF